MRQDLRQRADRLRAIPLENILTLSAARPDPHDPCKWHTARGALSVRGSQFFNWQRGTGGGGAIDLVIHLHQLNFRDDSHEANKRLSPIEEDLLRGARVIGEIHVNALTSTKDLVAQIKTKADSPIVKALFALAGKYSRPLNIHAQWDPDTVQEVERLAESSRGARLVIAHAGSFAAPAQMHAMFQRQTNVVCDLSVRGMPPLQDRYEILAAFDDRSIRERWKKLIEAYPDRFIVGVDTVSSWEEYEKVIRAIRFGLLANLSSATAEKVAYRNAQSWFGLE